MDDRQYQQLIMRRNYYYHYHHGEEGNEWALSIHIAQRCSALWLVFVAENHATGKTIFFSSWVFSCCCDVDIKLTEDWPWVPQEKAWPHQNKSLHLSTQPLFIHSWRSVVSWPQFGIYTNHGDTSAEGGGCLPVPQGWKDLDPFFSYRTGTLVLKWYPQQTSIP